MKTEKQADRKALQLRLQLSMFPKRNRATAIHKQRKQCKHYWLAKTYSTFFTDIDTKLNLQVYNLKKIVCVKCKEERII